MLDLLTSSGFVHQWTLVDGEARCLQEAVAPTHAEAAAAYGRSLWINDLLAMDAAGEVDAEVTALRRVRAGRTGETDGAYDAAAAALASAMQAAPPVAPPGAGRIRVRNLQLRKALTQVNLRGVVEDAVRAGPWQLKDLWDWSEFVHSDNEFIVAGCNQLGINDQQRMAIFAHAATIEV